MSIELTRAARPVATVFDLIGRREDDITYALGWALSRSPELTERFARHVLGPQVGGVERVRLQESIADQGRTDIELEGPDVHVIVEAKRGWDVPRPGQLEQYAPRFKDHTDNALVVLTEATAEHAAAFGLPDTVDGVPVLYVGWRDVADLAHEARTAVRAPVERALLEDIHTYLRSLCTMRDVTSNLVFVVSSNRDPLGNSGESFASVVIDHDRYFCPVGINGWPKDPPNYLGVRFDGRLQRVSYVEDYEIIARPDQGVPGLEQLKDEMEWTEKDGTVAPHWLFHLGPAIPIRPDIRVGASIRSRRMTIALDLLLTSDTLVDAERQTRKRRDAAGAAG